MHVRKKRCWLAWWLCSLPAQAVGFLSWHVWDRLRKWAAQRRHQKSFFSLLAYIVWLSRSFIHSSVYVIPPAHILHTELLQQVPACYFVFHAKSCMLVLRCQEKCKNSFRLKEHTCSMMQCGMHSSVHKSLFRHFIDGASSNPHLYLELHLDFSYLVGVYRWACSAATARDYI